jgi:hypothetical protein
LKTLCAPAAVDDRPPDQRAQLLVGHRRMGAERDEKIEGRDARPELAIENLEHHRHRHRPRPVGDEVNDALAVDRQPGETLTCHVRDFFGRQEALRDASADHSAHRTADDVLTAEKFWNSRSMLSAVAAASSISTR